jgi:hypothetical protein
MVAIPALSYPLFFKIVSPSSRNSLDDAMENLIGEVRQTIKQKEEIHWFTCRPYFVVIKRQGLPHRPSHPSPQDTDTSPSIKPTFSNVLSHQNKPENSPSITLCAHNTGNPTTIRLVSILHSYRSPSRSSSGSEPSQLRSILQILTALEFGVNLLSGGHGESPVGYFGYGAAGGDG